MWRLRTPRVYRYMPRNFAEDFFSSGALRLSSFRAFSEHADEQRLDSTEGRTLLVHRTSEKGGQQLEAEVHYGHDAYVLCGSMAPSKQLLADFRCDSAIVINETAKFALEIAKHVPGFRSGFEGPCSYQFGRIIEKDLGWLDFGPIGADGKISRINAQSLSYALNELGTMDAYFLKRDRHRHQVEYRFIWLTNEPIAPVLDIVAPEARRYCARWEEQGDVVAF